MAFKTPRGFTPSIAPMPPPGGKLYFCVLEGKLLVSERFELPYADSLAELELLAETEELLGFLDGQACVAAMLDGFSPIPEGAKLVGLRELLPRMRPELTAVAGRAVQVTEWERTHRFCGACGAPTERVPEERAKVCLACGLQTFPRLSPAVIVAVERGDEILLAQGVKFPDGVHMCLAGFVEPGESAEEAVRREVFEEVGIRVNNVRYFDSQPWPFPHSLMLGFFADYESGEIRLDEREIVSAAFFRADAMPAMFPGQYSISQWLIADFLRRQREERPEGEAP